ncbi:pou domain [Anaeramoeba flamelloides]|uniref:Pou domain n=1 Tax=Anaeramoeba flamelloides TaxID=1746091 RepID=A0ABQ8XQ98_9EUKA|nr:pou domain [Anaeramoeba flamelloides]
MADQTRRYTTQNERGYLRQQFIRNRNPNNEEVMCIAERLNWTRNRVARWFSNQRSRTPKHSKLLQELTDQKQMTNKLNQIYNKSLQQSDSRVNFMNWINFSIEGMKQDLQKSQSKEDCLYNKIEIAMSHLQNRLVSQIENESLFLQEVKNLQSPQTLQVQKEDTLGQNGHNNKNTSLKSSNNKTNKSNKIKSNFSLRSNTFKIETLEKINKANQKKRLLKKNLKKNDHTHFLSDRKRKKPQHTHTTTDKQLSIAKQPIHKIHQKLQPIPRNNLINENTIPLTRKMRAELSNSNNQRNTHNQAKTLKQIELEKQLSMHLNRIIQRQTKKNEQSQTTAESII